MKKAERLERQAEVKRRVANGEHPRNLAIEYGVHFCTVYSWIYVEGKRAKRGSLKKTTKNDRLVMRAVQTQPNSVFQLGGM